MHNQGEGQKKKTEMCYLLTALFSHAMNQTQHLLLV